MLRIKLVKTGKKDRPTWRVVVVEKTRTGKGAVTDYIGNYNPHLRPKEFKLDVEKYEKWVANGAQPTDAIKRLKGKMIDKTKEYQKEVETKVYKSKKPEAKQEIKKTTNQENKEEVKEEIGETKNEAAVEVENVEPEKEEKVEEAKEEPSAEAVAEEKAEEKAE